MSERAWPVLFQARANQKKFRPGPAAGRGCGLVGEISIDIKVYMFYCICKAASHRSLTLDTYKNVGT